MRLNARQRFIEFWTGFEAVPFSVGQSLSSAMGRLQAATLIILIGAVLVQAMTLWSADRRVDLAAEAALIAAEQPALVRRLGAMAGNLPPNEGFAASLAALRRNHAWLTTLPDPADAPARATPALAAVYKGTGYTLDARLEDLFALAERMRETPIDDAAPKTVIGDATPKVDVGGDGAKAADIEPGSDAVQVAELHRNAEGPLQDQLQQAAGLHAALAHRRLATLRWLQAATSITLSVLLVLAAIAFRRLEIRVVRVIGMLEGLASRDPLTGALSRHAFTAKLRRMLLTATPARAVGLILFDLDHFRSLNTLEGDAAGDTVLRAVARRLRNAAGVRATVVHLTSDSFAVVLPAIAHGHAELAAQARRLSAAMAEPVPFAGRLLRVGATAGTVLAPQDTADRGEMIRMAEIAVREAKQDMRGSVRAFRDPDTAAHARRETLLRTLAEPRFEGVSAWLQPVVRCSDRKMVGFEALARWDHPTLGRIAPAEFIPIAEASGRLPQISTIVRRAAFRTLAGFRAAGLSAPRLSLNLASVEFGRPATMLELERSLTEAGLTPAALEIEVTEDALLGDPENEALRALENLRDRGARLVLDDFGVGFASLVHLQRFHRGCGEDRSVVHRRHRRGSTGRGDLAGHFRSRAGTGDHHHCQGRRVGRAGSVFEGAGV